MAWFKSKKQNQPEPEEVFDLPQLCYDVAYFVLPHYAHNNIEKITSLCLESPTAAGPYFYLMACQVRGVEPEIEHAKAFNWQHGYLSGGREYFVLVYPKSESITMPSMSVEELLSRNTPVLIPYFSAVVLEPKQVNNSYFVLGQSPEPNRTTLRCVLPDGSNCNIGPGPDPVFSQFIESLDDNGSAAEIKTD